MPRSPFAMRPFTITVPSHSSAVEYHRGAVNRVLEPGRHPRRWGATRIVVDRRESLLPVAPQEVLTSDAVCVRVSATVRWAVADPVDFLERSTDPTGVVYLAAQVALRDALAGLSVEDLLRRTDGVSARTVSAAVAEVSREVGIDVRDVVVRDVIVPAELRAAATKIFTAKAKGGAQLEAARAETAALRSLANGARILDASPALARLRLVQSLPPGAQLVLTVGDDTVGPGERAGP